MPKLTLSAQKDVIEKARQLANDRGTSISAMFSQFIESISAESNDTKAKLPPTTRKAMGLVKLPGNKTDRDLLKAALAERHGH